MDGCFPTALGRQYIYIYIYIYIQYILIGRNNKIGTTVLPSSYWSVIIFWLLGKTVVKNLRRRQLNLFCLKNVVYYKLRDKTVVNFLVINIGTCFARSYNVFLADLKLL